MRLTDIAQWYLNGERQRKMGIEKENFMLIESANKMMYDAVKEFQNSKQSMEILFDEVDRLANLSEVSNVNE